MYKFEWNIDKAESNLRKHKVSFEEAATVFDDPFAMYFEDIFHSTDEQRFIVKGYSQSNKLLIVNFTMRNNVIRIISSRLATKKKKRNHEK